MSSFSGSMSGSNPGLISGSIGSSSGSTSAMEGAMGTGAFAFLGVGGSMGFSASSLAIDFLSLAIRLSAKDRLATWA